MCFLCSITNAKQILLDGGTNENLYNCDVFGEDGSITKYHEFNLLDGDLRTAVAINRKNGSTDKLAPYFYLIFKDEFPVDKIKIYNGFQINTNIYNQNERVKEIQLQIQNVKDAFDKYSFQSNIQISDSTNGQEIILGNEIEIKNIGIFVLSTDPGTKYDDICVSEMEFWYKGEKYEVSNLAEAKQEYVKLYTDSALEWMTNGIEVKGLTDAGFKKLVKLTGWGITQAEKKTMFVYFEKDGIVHFRLVHTKNGKTEYLPMKEVGNWKFDSDGRFWIKLKGGEWKASKTSATVTEKGGFLGTDLECRETGYAGPRGGN
jgi:hypothetical protein